MILSMSKVENAVEINGVVYELSSSNKWLLKQLEGGKKKVDGKWVEQKFDYLPMNMVYRLMDGLFKSYDIISLPTHNNGETFIVKKYDYETKQQTDEEAKVYGKTVEITVTLHDGTVRKVVGYAEWVAWIGILSKDNARNGFMRKLTARARKEALANLWQVFRIDAEFDIDEEVEVATIKEEASISWVSAPATSGVSPTDQITEKFTHALGEKLASKEKVDKKMLIAALKEVKKEYNVQDGTVEHEVIKSLLGKFLSQLPK